MIKLPSSQTRMPSSAVAVKVWLPVLKPKLPVQRAEKLSLATPLPGPPEPQLLLILDWQAVKIGLPLRVMLLKYSARYWPDGHEVGTMGKVRGLDVPAPALKTAT